MEATDNLDDIAASLVERATTKPDEAPEVEEIDDRPEAEEVDGEADPGEEMADAADEAETDEPDEVTEGDEEPRIAVKVDGKEIEVTLDDLKRSYSGQAYIQQKMQENAAKAKEAEDAFLQLSQARDATIALYQQLASGQFLDAPKPPSADLLERDPVRYMKERAAYEQASEEYGRQQEQITQLQQRQAQAQEYAQRAYIAEQMRELAQRIPEIADASKAGQMRDAMIQTGATYGYSADEIAQVMDHRALLVLHDAMKYRELQGRKQVATAKAEKARPVLRPGAKTAAESASVGADKARAKMRATGDPQDAVAFLLSRAKR